MNNPETYASILHSLAIFSIPVHFLGIYCILYVTPQKMANVKTSMLNLHLCGFWLDICLCILYTPYIYLPCPAGFSMGVMGYFEHLDAFNLYVLATSMGVPPVAILGFFENRHYFLVYRKHFTDDGKDKSKRLIYMASHYLLCAVYILPCVLNTPEQSSAKMFVKSNFDFIPPRVVDKPGFFVFATDATLTASCIAILITVVSTQMMYFLFKTVHFLFSHQSASQATYNLQKKLFLALCMQILMPLTGLALPVVYISFSLFTGYYNQTFTSLSLTLYGVHGFCAAVVMMVIHKPYRYFLLSMVFKAVPRKAKMSTRTEPAKPLQKTSGFILTI